MCPSRLSYCGEQVRAHDHDRYLTCLFAPAERREALFALYAFNHEIAKTREVVSEPMLGQIRLQWWRESLEGIYAGAPRDHAVVQALAAAVAAHGPSRARLDALIEARERDLEDAPPESLAELEAYAEGTSGQLVQLALEILGARGEAALAAGRDVGIAWALTGLLRAIPFHARHKRILLPRDLQDEVALDFGGFFELQPSESAATAVRRVAETARGHLSEARARRAEVSAAGRSALMLATLADCHLSRLQKARYDPFDRRLAEPPRGGAWRLAIAALRRRF